MRIVERDRNAILGLLLLFNIDIVSVKEMKRGQRSEMSTVNFVNCPNSTRMDFTKYPFKRKAAIANSRNFDQHASSYTRTQKM